MKKLIEQMFDKFFLAVHISLLQFYGLVRGTVVIVVARWKGHGFEYRKSVVINRGEG